MTSTKQSLTIDGSFNMHRGGELQSPVIAYETWGELKGNGENAVLLFTGLSPSAHAAASEQDPSPGWWEKMIGAGKPIDTDRYFVICANSLGSCLGSTGPASVNPETGERYGLDFPELALEDVARSTHAVLGHLNIDRLHSVIGSSMGGMTALAYCLLYPEVGQSLLAISSSMRSLPFAIALRSLQREIVRSDPEWEDGKYEPGAGPVAGMRLARKVGMITYRSAQEWEQRFGREPADAEWQSEEPFGISFAIESYLQAHANKFTGGFDPNCYLYLSRAMDFFDVQELSNIALQRVVIVGVVTDILFPIHQQRELADGLRKFVEDVEFTELSSINGHDSFLVDMDSFHPVIRKFYRTDTS
jgi:homoserine O-acetyltransferase/O-succinyltransferase